MNKGRVEAFSDGVLAVAITLLVLDLRVDVHSAEPLWAQLRLEWPTFAAYAVSFFFIGVIWLNHHSLFQLAARVDRRLLVYNLLLLLFATAIPFTTSTYADYVQDGGSNARVAVIVYGAAMEGMAISFTLILAHMLRAGLIDAALPPAESRRLLVRYGIGIVLYPLITLAALAYAPLMLVLYALVVGYYLGPGLNQLSLDPTEGTR